MNIPLAYPVDSHGVLIKDIFKLDPEESVVDTRVEYIEGFDIVTYIPKLVLSYSNIDYVSLPGLIPDNSTYMYVLAYNGTLGRSSGLYSQVVLTEEGVLDVTSPPVFTYEPNNLQYSVNTKPSDVILDINFYTAEANILQFKGVPVGGNNGPWESVYKYSYPFDMTLTPASVNKKTYFDGWYTSTFVVFRDVGNGSQAIENEIYSYEGFVGKAVATGRFEITSGGDLVLVDTDQNIIEEPLATITYEEFILASNNFTDINSSGGGLLANTQVMVSDELNNAIIAELKSISLDPACDDVCTIGDWQKLQQKRLGSHIYFREGDFRKAQIIMESARRFCATTNKKC